MVTFARTPTFQSSADIDFAVSDDGRAFTLSFGETGFQLDTEKWKTPLATTLFSLVVPVSGDEETIETEFIAETSVVGFGGATATVLLSVNGRSVVTDLPAEDSDQSFNTVLRYTGVRPSEFRLAFLLLGTREAQNPESNAILTGLVIDGEFLPRPAGPEGRPVPPPER